MPNRPSTDFSTKGKAARRLGRNINDSPTPDNTMSGRGDFLYRNGKQIGLDWEGIKARNAARIAEEAERLKTDSTLDLPEQKPKVLKKKAPTNKKVLKKRD